MTKDRPGVPDAGMEAGGKDRTGGLEEKEPAEVDCRCKEAEGKTIPQMLRLVVKDLAFWKKEKRGRR